jgi:hypothetical protein
VHQAQDLTADEVWTADRGPHIVAGNVSISARLTIEACARIEVAAGVALSVADQGTLAAEGESERPVVITGRDAGRWNNIHVAQTARLEMANATIERAGADAGTYSGCSIVLEGDFVVPPVPMAELQNVRIVGSAGYGLCLRGTAALDASSHDLAITGSGAESSTVAELQEAKCPLWISAEALGSVPVGDYTGNALDAICVNVQSDMAGEVSVQDRGVPYYLYYGGWPSVTVTQSAALNLGPGVTFQFDPQMSLKVDGGGTLRVEGTVDRPAVLTSIAPSPAPGGWVGVMFYGTYSANNRIDHARIENAGAACSCAGFSCHSEIYPNEAAVIFLGDPASSSFITNTTFANISGHGINRGWQSDAVPPDFTASNTFVNVALCAQTLPTPETHDCPAGLVCP